jgi:site-specific recombinase XerD
MREALTWEEIGVLHKLKLVNPTLVHIRNLVLFQIYTGLAYADIKALSTEHLYKGVNGGLWLKMERTKTHNTFTLPILKPAQLILDQYITQPVVINVPIFKVMSNQKLNNNLKLIQQMAGISKRFHTHLFRHTFASTVTLQSGIPLETVSKMLGHSKITMTQIYARVGEMKIANDMKQLTKKLN